MMLAFGDNKILIVPSTEVAVMKKKYIFHQIERLLLLVPLSSMCAFGDAYGFSTLPPRILLILYIVAHAMTGRPVYSKAAPGPNVAQGEYLLCARQTVYAPEYQRV